MVIAGATAQDVVASPQVDEVITASTVGKLVAVTAYDCVTPLVSHRGKAWAFFVGIAHHLFLSKFSKSLSK
jgi:hypothetical protein